MTVITNRNPAKDTPFDRDLDHLSPDQRQNEWKARIEAVLFASATPVHRDDLARIVGQGVLVDALIKDLQTDLAGRPYKLVKVGKGWMFQTRTEYADAIKAAADLGEQTVELNDGEAAVLCAVAYHQPIDRAALRDIFGKDISRDLLSRLRYMKLIASGPRSPKPGAPHTFVTTPEFLATFELHSLRDLPDLEIQNLATIP